MEYLSQPFYKEENGEFKLFNPVIASDARHTHTSVISGATLAVPERFDSLEELQKRANEISGEDAENKD